MPAELAARLCVHYRELRRWAARTALVGAGDAGKLVERHYAESLRALPLVENATRILDLGSGAGFPGWVLAAACPGSIFWLVESRQRKAAFLRAAAARAELSCHIVGARVSRRQPLSKHLGDHVPGKGGFELVTLRAVRMTDDIWTGMTSELANGARVLRWEGADPVEAVPGAARGRRIGLEGQRSIQEWLLPPADSASGSLEC